MTKMNRIEVMAATPIAKLNLGSTRLRRKIANAGFNSLFDLFALSDSDIDAAFDIDDANSIIGLKTQYINNPEEFAESALRRPTAHAESAKASAEEPQRPAKSASVPSRHTRRIHEKPLFFSGPKRLPSLPFTAKLESFELRAQAELDSLNDKYDDALIYQVFEEFATELDDIRETFQALFEHYRNNPRFALSIIDSTLRDAFLIYVADSARNEFDGENLWGNLFAKIEISDANVQSDFKRLFVDQLKRRNMPLYAADEKTNYYFYTALLHGGLSNDSWEELWETTFLPLAQKVSEGHYGFGDELDGRYVLNEIKKPESKFAPKKSVLNILEKAPDYTLAPLFDASFNIALQVEEAKRSSSEHTMLTNYGLPDAAMQALRTCMEQNVRKRTISGKGSTRRRAINSEIVYLPEARLQLDLGTGLVSLHWSKQSFPLSFAKSRIDFYIDGKLEMEKYFSVSVGKCILDSADISIQPQDRYDIELKLMSQSEGGLWEEKGSLAQTFKRNKPGCFEFVRSTDGAYHLRGKNEKISRLRRIAYIVKEGYEIRPGQGMKAVSTHDATDAWQNRRIFVYEVEPGASGAIVDSSTCAEIAVWQERYIAKVDKRRIIGETVNGLDLYGFVPSKTGTNAGLPIITIEAQDGTAAIADLDIVCLCDGKRISVPRHVLWEDNFEESHASRVALIPSKTDRFDWHAELCELEVRQKSANNAVVFRYRFAIVPIQEFRLVSAEFKTDSTIAKYQFQARLQLQVTNSHGDVNEIGACGRYDAEVPLNEEFLPVRIKSVQSGKTTDARLALAAIDIELPNGLSRIAEQRPICLADALSLGPAGGNVKLKARGWRYNRAAMVALTGPNFSFIPLFFKELTRPCECSFNLFTFPDHFAQAENEDPKNKPLLLTVYYGDDLAQGYLRLAWADIELFPCKEGLGFSSCRTLTTSSGNRAIVLDSPTLHDIRIEFRRKAGGRILEQVDILEGETRAVISGSIAYLLDTKKKVEATIVPIDWTGEPDYEFAISITLGGKQR